MDATHPDSAPASPEPAGVARADEAREEGPRSPSARFESEATTEPHFAHVMTGWELEVTCLDRQLPRSEQYQVVYDDLCVASFTEGTTVLNDYQLPDECTMIAITPPHGNEICWCGTEMPGNVAAIASCGRDYSSVFRGPTAAVNIVVANALLDELGLLHVCRAVDAKGQRRFVPLLDPGCALRAGITSACRAFERESLVSLDPSAARWLRAMVLDGVARIIQTAAEVYGLHTGRGRNERYALVRRAICRIDGNLGTPVAVAELARQLGVSTRVLQYAFQQVMGISPYEYALQRRLQAVRRRLQAGLRPGVITNAALAHGFTDLSRFDQQYRRAFAELPSDTIRRAMALQPRSPGC